MDKSITVIDQLQFEEKWPTSEDGEKKNIKETG